MNATRVKQLKEDYAVSLAHKLIPEHTTFRRFKKMYKNWLSNNKQFN